MAAAEDLDHPSRFRRLAAADELGALLRSGALALEQGEEVNNHVHTTYSFSPYHPARAAWEARRAGLRAVGIMDHDSVGGAEEMLAAARAIGIASTVGFELRVSFAGTALAGRKLNNPDSAEVAYVAVHGIPAGSLPEARRFLSPLNAARNARNRAMLARLNALLPGLGLPPLDFERDVVARSQAKDGGAITERHLLYALAQALVGEAGRGEGLLRLLRERLGLEVPARLAAPLADPQNPHHAYDLLGLLKSGFLDRVFIAPSGDECLPVRALIELAERLGAIPVYAYLGDVGESPTGDKKAERFEDAFLDELVPELRRLGFRGVTYMPPRNTREQLRRVRALCAANGLMEISGVDINSSRQSFRCPILLEPEFHHLVAATWALIAHEKLATADARYALFHPGNPWAAEPLAARIERYARVGRAIDPRAPERALEALPAAGR